MSLVIKHKGNVDDVYNVANKLGGDITGERVFRLVTEGEKALGNTDQWPGFVSTLASVGKDGNVTSNLFGNAHVLFFIDESGGFANFKRVEFRVSKDDVTRIYDLVGAQDELYEMKNISRWDSKYYDQMINDVRILEDRELENLTWVFRGKEGVFGMTKNEIIDGLVRRIQNHPDPEIRTLISKLEYFDTDNLVFTGGNQPLP